MALHILNAAPGSQAINNCLNQLSAGEPVVLMGDATYAAITECETLQALRAAGAQLHVLRDDAQLRGVIDKLDADTTVIGLTELVTLTEESPSQVSWF
ncbi:MAG: sulfurtransferase complex subunit TusB [Halioglobus sp.]